MNYDPNLCGEYIFSTRHKSIQLCGEYVVIRFDGKAELKRDCIISDGDYGDIYKSYLADLKLLEQSKLIDMKILTANKQKHRIKYVMKKYKQKLCDMSDDVVVINYGSKIIKLFQQLVNNGFIHNDFALRNIMIDENDELHWIDLDAINPINAGYIAKYENEYLVLDDMKNYFQKAGNIGIYDELVKIMDNVSTKDILPKRPNDIEDSDIGIDSDNDDMMYNNYDDSDLEYDSEDDN